MKKVILETKYVLMALIIVVGLSCSPEDGADGAQGPAGTAGQNGTNGTNGQDGNANVQTFVFDISNLSGSTFSLDIPEITQDVIDNDVILGYITSSFQDNYPIPGAVFGAQYVARTYINPAKYTIKFNLWNGSGHSVPIGEYDNAKIIIIESTSTTTKSSLSKQNVFFQLKAAGVDVNNYNEVIDYYGLSH